MHFCGGSIDIRSSVPFDGQAVVSCLSPTDATAYQGVKSNIITASTPRYVDSVTPRPFHAYNVDIIKRGGALFSQLTVPMFLQGASSTANWHCGYVLHNQGQTNTPSYSNDLSGTYVPPADVYPYGNLYSSLWEGQGITRIQNSGATPMNFSVAMDLLYCVTPQDSMAPVITALNGLQANGVEPLALPFFAHPKADGPANTFYDAGLSTLGPLAELPGVREIARRMKADVGTHTVVAGTATVVKPVGDSIGLMEQLFGVGKDLLFSAAKQAVAAIPSIVSAIL